MKVSVVVIGFGLVVFGRTALGLIRASYLKQTSENVSIDPSERIVLRYVWWYYLFPLLGFAGAVFMGWEVYHTTIPKAVLIYKIACVFCFLGGVFLLYQQLSARINIFEGKLAYKDAFDRWEISADEVGRVTLNGFTFIVKKRSENIVRVPATFEHSEIILAFLRQAAVNKE